MTPIPITIITGFLGAGKTTLILNLIPQLLAKNPSYRLALLKNEFGDVAIDSQLASSSSISGVREILGGCICCNLVGSLGDALSELSSTQSPDRILIETSGSAFPATLALEVNRLAKATGGKYVLDGVISVIDVENWKGYDDTSYTAKVQAKYTDLIVYNKWEGCSERRLDECRDRVGDLEVEVAWVKSRKGWVDVDVVFGVDGALARGLEEDTEAHTNHSHKHEHEHGHQSEVEVLSVELKGGPGATVDTDKLAKLLRSASKEEIYRIKAVLSASSTPDGSEPIASPETANGVDSMDSVNGATKAARYILNWAFGRWTFTRFAHKEDGTALEKEHESSREATLRMTMILARYESGKWKKKIEAGGLVELEGGGGELLVKKIS